MLRAAILTNARATSTRVLLPRSVQPVGAPVHRGARAQSSASSSGGGGGGSVAGKILIGVAAVGAATLGFARLDSTFSKNLATAVPPLKPVLKAVGCDVGAGGPNQAAPGSKSGKPADTPPSKLKKSDPPEEPKKARSEDAFPVEGKRSESAKPAPVAIDPAKEAELRRQKQNFILEQSLRDAAASAERSASEAASELELAAGTTEEYATKLLRALEEATGTEDQHMWREANDAKAAQSVAQSRADTKRTDAGKALQRLQDVIQKGRSDPATADNMNLAQAEQTLSKLQGKVSAASTSAAKSFSKLNLAQQFASAVEDGKKQLVEEVNAILPPGKSFSDPKSLTADDMNMLIYHAHRKIETLQRELSRMQLSDDEKAKEFRQQLATLDKEMGRQKLEVAKLVAQKVNEEREAFEVELQNQLRRQIGVHTDHLKEALEDQRAVLVRNHQLELEKVREEERSLQVARLAEAVELLQKMEAHLHARKLLDEASKKAKSLWLSCASLKHVLAQGRNDKCNVPQPLAADIVPLQEVSESSAFVKAVLATIPDEALKRGVYPEVALKERFYRVETACRRVALMEDQNGGGPGRYLLSYLSSLFMIYPKPVPQEELVKEQKVNPLMWDTMDILSRVRASLQREDLEQALRYANQLKGQPRQVASDWIRELRLLLETRQAASALMAYAAATVGQDQAK